MPALCPTKHCGNQTCLGRLQLSGLGLGSVTGEVPKQRLSGIAKSSELNFRGFVEGLQAEKAMCARGWRTECHNFERLTRRS